MKRKIMAILLAAAMTGSLAGCGSTQDKNAADASEQKMKVAMVGIPKVGKANLRDIAFRSCPHTGNNLDMTLHRFKNQIAFRADCVNSIHYKIIFFLPSFGVSLFTGT